MKTEFTPTRALFRCRFGRLSWFDVAVVPPVLLGLAFSGIPLWAFILAAIALAFVSAIGLLQFEEPTDMWRQ